ncbi:MAG: glycerol-3-phosphate 1-O-acyltransferase PlsY [Dehalococcoidia bacterium]
MTTPQVIAFAVCSYLLGSVSFGLVLGRLLRGIDIRDYGSGSAGATNTGRTLGLKAFIAVFVLDLLKGLIPVVIAKVVADDARLEVIAGLAAIIGHDFPIFHGFRGGRGIATSIGATIGMMPLVGLLIPFLAGVILIPFRYVSLMSVLGGVVTALIIVALAVTNRVPDSYAVFAVIAAALIVWPHRGNITRRRAGTEPKLGQGSGVRPRDAEHMRGHP